MQATLYCREQPLRVSAKVLRNHEGAHWGYVDFSAGGNVMTLSSASPAELEAAAVAMVEHAQELRAAIGTEEQAALELELEPPVPAETAFAVGEGA